MVARQSSMLGLPAVSQQLSADFFVELRSYEEVLPRWDGELYLEKHQGTLTTQGAVKAGNRRLEHELHDLEYVGAVAVWSGAGAWPGEVLDSAWGDVLLHQFHDMLPGSSIPRVHRESREMHARQSATVTAATSALLTGLGEAARRGVRQHDPCAPDRLRQAGQRVVRA